MIHRPSWCRHERTIVILGYVIDFLVLYFLIRTGNDCWSFAFILPGQIIVYNYMDARNKQARCSHYTQGRIVDTVCKIGGTWYRRWTKFPVVEFEADGQTYRAEGNDGNDQYNVGDEVWIYFNPEKPTEIAQSFPAANRNFCIIGGVCWGLGVLWAIGTLI
jgi:hypothetical protein